MKYLCENTELITVLYLAPSHNLFHVSPVCLSNINSLVKNTANYFIATQ